MTLHLRHVWPLDAAQLASETLSYSVRIERTDPATGIHDAIEIDGYGVLSELLEALDDAMQKQRWLT